MKRYFVNYAFTTSLYSQKKNFLATFSPFVLKILHNLNRVCTDQEINELMVNNFDLIIPTNTIKSILNGLLRQKFVKVAANNRNSWQGCITQNGIEEVEKFIENEQDVERRQNHLIDALGSFLKNRGLLIPNDKLQTQTLDYIQRNLSKLAIFDTNGINEGIEDNSTNELFDNHLTNFVSHIEQKEPLLYSIYEELVKGAIIRDHIENKSELVEFASLEPLTIYLDTNIILSLFEFHHPSLNAAAKQLFELLNQDKKIRLKVFSFTLEEIARLLKSYRINMDNYNPSIPVNSIFYFLKNKEYDDYKIDSLINSLDQKVTSLGIIVEQYDFKKRNEFTKDEEELYKDIYSYKNDQNNSKPNDIRKDEEAIHQSALHDANIIIAIKKKRGSWVQTLERSKAIFLTSSFLMDHFCKQVYKKSNRFPEVILDLTLTNILWLRNPNKSIGVKLHQLISVHSKGFILDNGIWTRFVKTLKGLFSEGDIDKAQFATVFSNNQLTIDYLQNANIDDISPQSVLNLSQRIEKEFKLKDEIITEKEKTLSETKGLLSTEKENVSKLNEEKTNLEKWLNESVKNLEKASNEINILRNERDCLDYIDKKMDEEFYPLRNKVLGFIIAISCALLLMYFAEIADYSDYQSLRIPFQYRKFIKFIGFLYPTIFALINRKNLLLSIRFHLDNSSLKREFEKRFKREYYEKI